VRCPACDTDNAPENVSCWRCGADLTPIPKAPADAPLLDRIVTEYQRRGFGLIERTDRSARLLSRATGEKRVEVDWAGNVTVDGHQMPQERVDAFLTAEPVPAGMDMHKVGIGCGAIIGVFVILGLLSSVMGWSNAAITSPTPDILTATGGSTASPVTTSTLTLPTATAVGVGRIVHVKNWDLNVTGVDKPGQSLVWSELGNKSPATGTWIVVLLEVTNTGKQNYGVNTGDFALLDTQGDVYDPSLDVGALLYSEYRGGKKLGVQVPPGITVTYHIAFDINPSASGLVLLFKQDTQPQIALGI
jgi:hypothetical protein